MMNGRRRWIILRFLAVLCILSIAALTATPSPSSPRARAETTTKPTAPAGGTGSSVSSGPEATQNKSTPTDKQTAPQDRTKEKDNKTSEKLNQRSPSASQAPADTTKPTAPAGGTAPSVSTGANGTQNKSAPTDKKTAPQDRTEGKENKTSETNNQKSASIFDGPVKFISAVQSFISAIFINWVFIVFVVLYWFRDSIRKVLDRFAEAMGGGGVTLDVYNLKLQIADRLIEVSDDSTTFFSPSPFEIKTGPARDEATTLGEIVPQLTFAFTDYVAKLWSKEPLGLTATHEMEAASRTLSQACQQTSKFQDVKSALVDFAKNLEETRFLEANGLMALLDKHQFLRDGIEQIQPGNGDGQTLRLEDFLILHCTAIVYAHKKKWSRAKALLDKIEWKNDAPYYVPAGNVWLACAYHEYIESLESNSKLDPDSSKFFADVDVLLSRGGQVFDEMSKVDWNTFSCISIPPGYYKRELLKIRGNIASILGDYSNVPEKTNEYYDLAEWALKECTKTIDGDPPSPLDHNNLADLYRQTGKCTEAHQELEKALSESKEPDPTFYSTLAMIFWKERQPWKGMLSLDCYGEAEARQSGAEEDIHQHFENQILWAKLADAVDPMNRDPYLAMVTRKLEDARRFLNEPEIRWVLDPDDASKLQVKIGDLLGFAYLQLPGYEIRSTEVFDRLSAAGAMSATEELGWRRRINHAKVLTRLARSQRRTFSSQMAAQSRHHAMITLADGETALKSFGLDPGLPVKKRSKHFLLHLDTVITMQDLAEEFFCGSELQRGKELLEQEEALLISLRATMNNDVDLSRSLDDKRDAIRSKVRLCEAQRCFLLGRIHLGLDPSFSGSDLMSKIEGNLNAARGIDPNLDCGIDLVLGEVLLAAALAGKGDARSLYQRAVSSFELAATRDAPELRAESIKALADAYAKRNVVMRKKKASTSGQP